MVMAVLGCGLGWLGLSSRISVYLSIVTQAMTYALMLAFFRNEMGFGGNNGLTDFKDILGFDLARPATKMGLYLLSAVMLGVTFLVVRFVAASKLGRVMMAVRDAESRVRFLGYSVTGVKLFAFTLSACWPARRAVRTAVGIINPAIFAPIPSKRQRRRARHRWAAEPCLRRRRRQDLDRLAPNWRRAVRPCSSSSPACSRAGRVAERPAHEAKEGPMTATSPSTSRRWRRRPGTILYLTRHRASRLPAP